MATTAVPTQAPHAKTAYDEHSGIWGWLTTVDHKRIGILYLYTALAFFIIGGLEANNERIGQPCAGDPDRLVRICRRRSRTQRQSARSHRCDGKGLEHGNCP